MYLHGRSGYTEDAVRIHATANGVPLYIWPDTGNYGVRFSGDTGLYIPGYTMATVDSIVNGGGGAAGSDTADIKTMLEGNPGIVGSDTTTMKVMATNNPSLFYGPTGSGAGTGSYQVKIYALDTSGTDACIEGVKVTAQDAAGGIAAFDWTDGTGKVTFALDGATYTLLARKTGYLWPNKSLTVSGNIDSTAIQGYDVVLSDVGAENCNVYGYLTDGRDNPLVGAYIVATKTTDYPAVDTSGSFSSIVPAVPVEVYTDTLGLFQLSLRRTTDMADTVKGFWNISGKYGTRQIFNVKKFYVPDQGTLDLGDTIMTRGQ